MQDKPVIIYVGAFELPDKNAAAHRVIANAKIFRDLGYEVVFLGVTKSMEKNTDIVSQDESHFGFDCWNVAYPSSIAKWLAYITDCSALKYLLDNKYAGRVEAVVNYNHPAVSQLRSLYLCRQHGIKHIADITEWYDTSSGPILRRTIKKIDTVLRMHLVNYLEDGIITTSPYITDMYSNRGMITVELPTLFDCSEIQNIDENSAENIISECVNLIYVCSPLDPNMVNKNRSNLKERLDVIILYINELYSEGINIKLNIYGNTFDEYILVFPEQASVLKTLKENIRFHGKVDNKIVRRKIAEADFNVFIRDENRVTLSGFPGKFSESVSIGTPVITNSMINISKYEASGCTLMAKRGNELQLLKRAAMLRPEEIQKLKQHCKKSKLFHYETYISQVKAFFDLVGVNSNVANK